jgi:hypothetical protein
MCSARLWEPVAAHAKLVFVPGPACDELARSRRLVGTWILSWFTVSILAARAGAVHTAVVRSSTLLAPGVVLLQMLGLAGARARQFKHSPELRRSYGLRRRMHGRNLGRKIELMVGDELPAIVLAQLLLRSRAPIELRVLIDAEELVIADELIPVPASPRHARITGVCWSIEMIFGPAWGIPLRSGGVLPAVLNDPRLPRLRIST